MMHKKKQMKLKVQDIRKLFKTQSTKLPEDFEDLQEEIEQLELKLKAKHDELFSLQRNSHRQRFTDDYISKKSAVVKGSQPFTRPEKIVLLNSVESLKREIELMSLLSGVEVQSYVEDEHCAVVYHMQHSAEHQVTHGLKIDMKSGSNTVSSSCLPLGFNLPAVLEQFDNVMLPVCLGAVRKALAAYYDRLHQFNKLKKTLRQEADLCKVLDGSHIEIKFAARSELEAPDEQIGVTLMLDYRVYDIRPKQVSFVEIDLPDGSVEALSQQCAVFKRKSLHKAFKEAFIDGVGPYTMVQQLGVQAVWGARRRKNKRARTNNPYNNNDDTFHPEDCSSEDDVEE